MRVCKRQSHHVPHLTHFTDSKIDLLDAPDVVVKKVRKAECVPKVIENNGVLALVEYVLLPASGLRTGKREFRVDRERDGLEPLVYTEIKQMHSDFESDILTPQLLKPAVARGLNEIMEPIQAEFQGSQEWQDITVKAYPPPVKEEKKKKQKKDKGSKFPGKDKEGEGEEPPTTETELPVR